MKNFLMKSGISALSAVIVIAAVVICMSAANRLEYMELADTAEKNAEYISPVTNSPGQNAGKAEADFLKKDMEPFTAEDFSYMVIDGVQIGLPCTVGMLAEHFELKFQETGRDETGIAYVAKDGIRIMQIRYYKNADSKAPYSDCVAYEITPCNTDFSSEVVLGGISNKAGLTDIELNRFFGGTEEYIFKKNLFLETEENGFIMVEKNLDFISITYYDGIEDADETKRLVSFQLYEPSEIRLKDSYDPETYQPISLDELDLSAFSDEIDMESERCIYDVLLEYQTKGQDVCVYIWSNQMIDDSHAYLFGEVRDPAGTPLASVCAVLCDGQELGESLVTEYYEYGE